MDKHKRKKSVSQCTNKKIGKLLMDFIAGDLKAKQSDEFEKHYLKCDACFAEYVFKLETQIALKHEKRMK
ncbi:MAG: hypothetical protein ABII25_09155 [bacterium]